MDMDILVPFQGSFHVQVHPSQIYSNSSLLSVTQDTRRLYSAVLCRSLGTARQHHTPTSNADLATRSSSVRQRGAPKGQDLFVTCRYIVVVAASAAANCTTRTILSTVVSMYVCTALFHNYVFRGSDVLEWHNAKSGHHSVATRVADTIIVIN